MRPLLIALASALAFSIASAHAEQNATPAQAISIIEQQASAKDVFRFDYAVPGSPALSLLGLDSNKVTQSNSLRPFVLSLPSVLGSGDQGQAIALDVAPGWLIPSDERTYSRYVGADREWRRHALRTRVSLGLYEGAADAANPAKNVGSRAALGLSSSWLDASDPLMARFPGQPVPAWEACLARSGPAIQAILDAPLSVNARAETAQDIQSNIALIRRREELESDLADARAGRNEREMERIETELEPVLMQLAAFERQAGETQTAAQNALREAYARSAASREVAKCAKEADQAARTARDFDIGLGAVWRGQPGQLSDFEDAGGALWLSYRHPFGLPRHVDPAVKRELERLNTWWTVGGAVRAGFDEFVTTGVAATPEIRADTLDAWVGVERNEDGQRFALQLGYQDRDPAANAPAGFDRSRSRYLVSWARRLGDREDSVWISISYGDAQGHGAFKDDDLLLVSLVFAPPDATRIFGAP